MRRAVFITLKFLNRIIKKFAKFFEEKVKGVRESTSSMPLFLAIAISLHCWT